MLGNGKENKLIKNKTKHTPEEPKTLEAEESPEAHTPEEQKMLEAEESPEAHTPEEQKMLEASETTDSAIGSQDRTDAEQARASCRKEINKREAPPSRRRRSKKNDKKYGREKC